MLRNLIQRAKSSHDRAAHLLNQARSEVETTELSLPELQRQLEVLRDVQALGAKALAFEESAELVAAHVQLIAREWRAAGAALRNVFESDTPSFERAAVFDRFAALLESYFECHEIGLGEAPLADGESSAAEHVRPASFGTAPTPVPTDWSAARKERGDV